MTTGSRNSLSLLLFAICLAGGCLVAFYLYWQFSTTPDTISETSYDSYRQEALRMLRTESDDVFTICLVLIGAMWGTFVVSKENRLRPQLEIVGLFVLTNIFLVAALFFNWKYSKLLAQLFWDMGPLLENDKVFDLMNSPWIELHYQALLITFYGSLVLSAATTVSTILTKGKSS